MSDHLRTVACRACGEYIVFLPTSTGSKMPVDADSVSEGDEAFDPKLGHISHFSTCPEAGRFRKRGEK